MAKDYYRIDLRVSRKTIDKLKRVKRESENALKKKVSVSRIIEEILNSYIDTLPNDEVQKEIQI